MALAPPGRALALAVALLLPPASLAGLAGCSRDGLPAAPAAPGPAAAPGDDGPDILPASRPNILLILVDELRADALSIGGHPFFSSPAIDRIGQEGAWFPRAFVTTSLCAPSRATMLTGRYAHEHGIDSIWEDLPYRTPNFGAQLRAAGYATAWVGKWHLQREALPHPGFERWVSFPGQGSYRDPGLNVDGRWTAHQGHMTDILHGYAEEFLDGGHDRPFLLVLSHLAAHSPWDPPDRFVGMFDGVDLPLPANWGTPPAGSKPGWLGCREFDGEAMQRRIRSYYEHLASVEESTGRLLARLESMGILDDTLVLLVGDNGYQLGEFGLSDKRTAYEPSMGIPILARHPASIAAGTVAAGTLALNLDIASTITHAAGAPRLAGDRGIPLQQQASGARHRPCFLYSYELDWRGPNPLYQCVPTIRAVRTLDWKYIEYSGHRATHAPELYFLAGDPLEMRNFAGLPGYATVQAQLVAEMAELRRELGDVAAPAPARPRGLVLRSP